VKAVAITPKKAKSARLIDVPAPTPTEKEALVQVLQVGIDGTDLEIHEGLYGEAPPGYDYLIIGHEALGRVKTAPPDSHLKPDDLVVATVRRPCPQRCINCHSGESDMCITGDYTERGIKALHGYLTEYYTEKPEYLVKIPPALERVAVLLEPLSIVEKAITQIYRIQERMHWQPTTALVLGAGTIGLLATMLLRHMGLDTYTLATRPPKSEKAIRAELTGATYLSAREHNMEDLKEELGNIDIIIEATGNSTVAFNAMRILGTNGIMSLIGVTGGDKRIEICSDCINLEFVLGNKVVFGSVNANRTYFEKGVQHMLEFEKQWPKLLESLITRRHSIEEYADALQRQKHDIKTIIEIS
jgi:threonine dehydrogenase-like Zn-dependent dehydrogenase